MNDSAAAPSASHSGDAASDTIRMRDRRWFSWGVGGLIALAFVVGTLGNEFRVQDWDPQYTRTAIERTIVYGGSYYENAIVNKGPLEPFVYHAATWVTSFDGYWYAISAVSTLLSMALAAAIGWTAVRFGAVRWIAWLVAAIAFMHFSFSPAAYAGVVYVRNLTVVLLAACWVLLLSERAWATRRRRVWTTAAIAALVGLAVQSLLTTVLSGLVLLAATLIAIRRRTEPWEPMSLAGVGMISGTIVFVSAPLWYWIRGAIEEFWAGWWVYSNYVRAATGSSLADQLQFGWDQLFAYYQTRPLLFTIVLGTGIVTVARWRRWTTLMRLAHVTLMAWWGAAWLELALTERYSSHYFSVTAVPTAFMAALLVGHIASRLDLSRLGRAKIGWSIGILAVAVYLIGPSIPATVGRALEFRGVDDVASSREANLGGNGRTSIAVLDLVSEEGDPLLGWTNDPWPYLTLGRVSATRFIWKSFMVGEIYLAPGGGPTYVLPETWDWFFEDLEESDPLAMAQVGHPIDPDTPFATHVDANFTKVYEGDPISLYLQNDVATGILESSSPAPWVSVSDPPAGSGWHVDGPGAMFVPSAVPADQDLLPIGGMCTRIAGTMTWPPEGDGILAFVFQDPTGVSERLHIGVDRGRAFSGSDFVMYEEESLGDAGVGRKEFALVVGSRSAALVMEGRIVAALRLLTPMTVSVQPRADTVGLLDLTVDDPPPESGC